jgi:hypothetical protein
VRLPLSIDIFGFSKYSWPRSHRLSLKMLLRPRGRGAVEGFALSYVIYKGYVIIASAARDETTGEWRPVSSVSWQRPGNGSRGIHLFNDISERFASFAEATSFAMALARNWVDRRGGILD